MTINRIDSRAAVVGGLLFYLPFAVRAGAAEQVHYFEGFEGDKNPVKFWTRGPYGQYQVNFAGLTTEKAHSGGKSFKLDITFIKEGNFNYWAGPILDIPAVAGMRLSGYIYLERVPPNVSAGLGHSFYLPAFRRLHPDKPGRGMCGPIHEFGRRHTGKWIRQEADLGLAGKAISMAVLKEPTPGVRLDKWYLHITCRGAEDARLIVYLDDISVAGRVPDHWEQLSEAALNDWENQYVGRRRASRRRFETRLAALRRRVEQVVAQIPGDEILASIPQGPWRRYGQALLREIRAKRDELLNAAAPGRKELPKDPGQTLRDLVDTGTRPLAAAIENLRRLNGNKDPFLVFVRHDPISNYRVLPTRSIVDGPITDEISMFASPGEYEPAAFVLLPAESTRVTFQIGALRSDQGTIGAENLDLRVVKVWYQAGIGIGEVDKRILTPELLLHDDDLVQVDHGRKVNTVRDLDAPRDAPALLPVRIAAGTVKQFWLTVHVPDEAAPGDYRGRITVGAEGLGRRDLTIRLRVLPIRLEEPFLDYGLYYRGYLGPNRPRYVSSELKTARQLEAELRNMKAHGITWPDVYQKPRFKKDGTLDFTDLDRYLQIKKRVGLPVDPLLYLGIGTGTATDPREMKKRLDLLKQVLAFAKRKGINQVYFYGQDEARGERLKRQRPMWQAVHRIGGKVFVACSTGFFELVGDLLDLPIVARESPGDVPRVHSLGRKIYNYAKPQAGLEQPYTYRYYFGHWLVRSGMDGSHTYAYLHGAGPKKSMGRPWDDFDNKVYRVLAFAYPTADGVVDTVQWEGVREAVDDVRYLTTLRKAVAAAEKSGKPGAAKLAGESKKWLETMDIEGDLGEIRRQMAARIIELRETAPPGPPNPR